MFFHSSVDSSNQKSFRNQRNWSFCGEIFFSSAKTGKFLCNVKWLPPLKFTLQGTNISHQNSLLKMIFLFPRWDMLIPWRVTATRLKKKNRRRFTRSRLPWTLLWFTVTGNFSGQTRWKENFWSLLRPHLSPAKQFYGTLWNTVIPVFVWVAFHPRNLKKDNKEPTGPNWSLPNWFDEYIYLLPSCCMNTQLFKRRSGCNDHRHLTYAEWIFASMPPSSCKKGEINSTYTGELNPLKPAQKWPVQACIYQLYDIHLVWGF